MKWWTRGVWALSLVLAAACGDDGEGGGGDDRLTAVTWNLGLARGYVDYADERAPEAVAALAAQEADAVCVQEVWYPEHVTALTQATADMWPNTVFLEPDPGEATGEPACTEAELTPFAECMASLCADTPTDQTCALMNCAAEFTALSSECLACLVPFVGQDVSLETVQLTCTTGGAGGYAYGGAFGIGLLTDLPILAQDHLVLESTYNRRAVLHARLDDPDLGPVDVYCTHLSAIFSDIPYPDETSSWEAEQAAQIDALLAWVEGTAQGDARVLLGDFNTGPAAGTAVAEYPDNFQKFTAAYRSAYATQGAPECSFCGDNPLVGGGEGVLIDHVLVSSELEVVSARRVFTDPVEIEVDGQTVTTALSDHYGVEAVLAPIPTND